MTHVELFAGIGGISIAAEWAGFETIVQVERDPYCLKVLEKHWPDVHRCREIRDFPDQDYGAVTLVSGGPPCQPASTAGKRGGRSDDRWLWPEFARIVERLLPAWVLAENPLGILSLENGLAIKEWIARLETQDYAFLPPLVYPIAALGADHRRYRVFFVAHLDGVGRGQRGGAECKSFDAEQGSKNDAHFDSQRGRIQQIAGCECKNTTDNQDHCEARIAADIDGTRRQVLQRVATAAETSRDGSVCISSWWDTRSRLLRMVSRIRGRMDGRRIKALGNSCSPQQVYPILQAIAEVER